MANRKMHADEVYTDVPLVRRLVATQFPRWAGLQIEPVLSSGTVNAMYRLGEDMAVRLPRRRAAWAMNDLDTEWRWLPRLAPHLPLAIPVPLAMGAPVTSTRGIGPSTGGWKARMRRSIALAILSMRRPTWRASWSRCNKSILPTDLAQARRTREAAGRARSDGQGGHR
jgi:hypothetical protein